jgi:hypothetical protein
MLILYGQTKAEWLDLAVFNKSYYCMPTDYSTFFPYIVSFKYQENEGECEYFSCGTLQFLLSNINNASEVEYKLDLVEAFIGEKGFESILIFRDLKEESVFQFVTHFRIDIIRQHLILIHFDFVVKYQPYSPVGYICHQQEIMEELLKKLDIELEKQKL